MCRVPARSATAQWLLRRHEALQFLVEVLHDDELRSRGRLVRAAARLDHQKPLAVGGEVASPASIAASGREIAFLH